MTITIVLACWAAAVWGLTRLDYTPTRPVAPPPMPLTSHAYARIRQSPAMDALVADALIRETRTKEWGVRV